MKVNNLNRDIVVIADDFTGANDAGVSLALSGKKVSVAFKTPFTDDTDALVINSDSRAMKASEAAEKLAQYAADVHAAHWLIKKIDSTLRGNPGAEIEALLALSGKRQAIIAPAFPAAGRTTENGVCLVKGVPVTDTEFASDPKTPVRHAQIAAVLAEQTALTSVVITPEQLAAALESDARLVIVDARSDDDLDRIIAAAFARDERPLLVGSAGLCDALARRLATPRQLLAVIGSMSEIAQQQIQRVRGQDNVSTVLIDINDVFNAAMDGYQQQIAAALAAGQHCVVHTCADTHARHQIDALCEQRGLSRAALGETISAFLGELTRNALETSRPAALYVSGGDVAMAVASTLNAQGFAITGQVAQCVPFGRFLGCRWQGPVMTKAGGFGTETTLLEVLHFIEEKMSD
ncbi:MULTISPECIES: D-threonate kinase [unclassified Leclercia]|uniref:Four-carbon acid sugar kinase family protein n=1 Tax=Leclercia barmai TaxID=2785629 RepID=A0ABS7RSD5_9ENTR|nr:MULTISPECIES: four-carbon acid sugar kinase family protein [unclassified Leclercia]MBZ0057221.1 four-carbon acid sugar kinase family protein [Leclercia sp. EMC7]MCM5695393.1 four-carbon acid sugar kinase family protein [Leclercia sp. LTM01]MCM5699800.1 four-carbon acid sugar kinase family protein [Leclercia sp. LTM14]